MVYKISKQGFEHSNIDTISSNVEAIVASITYNALPKSGMTATASFEENSGLSASKAIDGNTSTRWASNGDPASPNGWLAIDLGASYTLSEMQIYWEFASASAYKIQYKTSSSATDWTDNQTLTGQNGGYDTITFSPVLTCTNIRILGQTMATQYAMSIYELYFTGYSASTSTSAYLITWPLAGTLTPTITTDSVDFTTSTISGNVDSSTINSRFALQAISGSSSFVIKSGYQGLLFTNNYYQVGATTIQASELLSKTDNTNIWSGSTDLHTDEHSLCAYIYIQTLNQVIYAISGDTVKKVSYLLIDSSGYPYLIYNISNTHRYQYKMNIQLQTNQWYKIRWYFSPGSINQWRIRGYVDEVLYGSKDTVGTTVDTLTIAIGPDADVAIPFSDNTGSETYDDYLVFGGNGYGNAPSSPFNTYYLRDVTFSSGNVSTNVSLSANTIYSTTKRFKLHIEFSSSNPLPNKTQAPYILQVYNSNIRMHETVHVSLPTSISYIEYCVYNIIAGSFKISIYNCDTTTSFTGTLTLNCFIST